MPGFRTTLPVLARSSIVVASLALGACAANRPYVVVASGTSATSAVLRDTAFEAEQRSTDAAGGWIGARLVATNSQGLRRLAEGRVDASIVALIVVDRAPDDAEPVGALASSGLPTIVLERRPGERGVLCVCAGPLTPDPEARVRAAVSIVDAAVHRAGWRDRRSNRAAIAAILRRSRFVTPLGAVAFAPNGDARP